MPSIKCSGKDCTATFNTTEVFHPKARYTCREHTAKNKDEERFQKHQFDPDLRRSSSPIGTSHIHNQGSDVQVPTGTDTDGEETDG